MFWIFLLVLVLALVFFQLGSYAVWFGMLKAAVNVLLLVTGGFVLVAIWKWFARNRQPAHPSNSKGSDRTGLPWNRPITTRWSIGSPRCW